MELTAMMEATMVVEVLTLEQQEAKLCVSLGVVVADEDEVAVATVDYL